MADNTVHSESVQDDALETELKDIHARMRALVHAIPDLVWMKDQDGAYLFCNGRFEQFFGAKEQEIVGKTDYDFMSLEMAEFFRRHDRIAVEKGGPSIK